MLLNHFNILTLETFRKNTHFAQKRLKLQFFYSPTHLCRFAVNHCNFLTKTGYYKPDLFILILLNLLTCKSSQKLYSNNMKKLYRLEIFGLLDNFCVKLKHLFIRSRHLSLEKVYWTTQSVVVEHFLSSNP